MKYIKALPLNDSPELFGLHDNANMTYAQNETFAILDKFVLMQAKTGSAGGKSQEEVIEETAKQVLARVPQPFDIEDLMSRHPVVYEESMNTVLQQEVGPFTVPAQSCFKLLKWFLDTSLSGGAIQHSDKAYTQFSERPPEGSKGAGGHVGWSGEDVTVCL